MKWNINIKKLSPKVMATLCLICMPLLSINPACANTLFSLKTNAFIDQGPLPVEFTCDGDNHPPQLFWVSVPPRTKSLALVFSDPDAPKGIFYHWLVFNIPPSVTALPENTPLPNGSVVSSNSWNKKEYRGPCPPKGASHLYIFTLYALDTTLKPNLNLPPEKLVENLQKHTLQKVTISAIYGRPS